MASWSTYDLHAVGTWAGSEELASGIAARYVDAKRTAKRWRARFHPDVVFPRDIRSGRARLHRDVELIEYEVPARLRNGVTGTRIRYVREQLTR